VVTAQASDIAHRGRAICNPIGSQTLDLVVERLAIAPGSPALDVGCGKGELLVRLGLRYEAGGLGVDVSQERIDGARERARVSGVGQLVRFECADARAISPPARPLALAACVGSTHALGGLVPTLSTLASWTAPGGWLLIGEGFWAQDPPQEYLDAIGATAGELGLDGWVEAEAARLGFEAVERWISTRGEWDEYEDTLLANVAAYSRQRPDDGRAQEMFAQQRSFHEAQARWGRKTMGFAVHALRKPA
jgi:SAM-dependent methyltransferase